MAVFPGFTKKQTGFRPGPGMREILPEEEGRLENSEKSCTTGVLTGK
jgi:hypothetical protein